MNGRIKDIELFSNPDGSIKVDAFLRDIHLNLWGRYRSQATFCAPLSHSLGASVNPMDVTAKLWILEGETPETLNFKLRIQRTHMGRIHLSQWFPDWLENFLTSLANRAARVVWRSQLGDWISDRLTQLLKEKLGEDAEPKVIEIAD